MRILLVEDDQPLARAVVSSLAQSSYVTDVVHTASAALTACATTTYQLVILDLGLPDLDGIDVLRRLKRQKFLAPVLILTARDELQDRVRGLDAGGDDYLAKPFAMSELEARMRALLRRGNRLGTTWRLGRLEFDPVSRHATIQDRVISFSARELAVLELLLQRPGRVVSKSQIFESIYHDTSEQHLEVIEVFISRLRHKLLDEHAGVNVRVLRGLGYRLELNAPKK